MPRADGGERRTRHEGPAPGQGAIDTLTDGPGRPLRRPTGEQEVAVMAGPLETEGPDEPLIGLRDGKTVKIVNGRVRQRALSDTGRRGPPAPAGRHRPSLYPCRRARSGRGLPRRRPRERPDPAADRERARPPGAGPGRRGFLRTVRRECGNRTAGLSDAGDRQPVFADHRGRTAEPPRRPRRSRPPRYVSPLTTSCDRDTSLKQTRASRSTRKPTSTRPSRRSGRAQPRTAVAIAIRGGAARPGNRWIARAAARRRRGAPTRRHAT